MSSRQVPIHKFIAQMSWGPEAIFRSNRSKERRLSAKDAYEKFNIAFRVLEKTSRFMDGGSRRQASLYLSPRFRFSEVSGHH